MALRVLMADFHSSSSRTHIKLYALHTSQVLLNWWHSVGSQIHVISQRRIPFLDGVYSY